MSNSARLQHFLQSLATEKQYSTESDYLSAVVPQLAEILGYSPGQVFFEPALIGNQGSKNRVLRPDTLFFDPTIGRPGLIVEVKVKARQVRLEETVEQIEKYLAASGATIGLVLFFDSLLLIQTGEHHLYRLSSISADEALRIFEAARPGREAPLAPLPVNEPSGNEDYARRLDNLLNAAEAATSNDEKKRTLESLATTALGSLAGVRCKYTNLNTKSSEIDIVCECIGGARRTLFDEFGRYFLVECKNWRKPVTAASVRDFLGKMQATRCSLGLLFSRHGVTGRTDSTDALRVIDQARQQGSTLLFITFSDLRTLNAPDRLYALIDEKLDRLRFDLL